MQNVVQKEAPKSTYIDKFLKNETVKISTPNEFESPLIYLAHVNNMFCKVSRKTHHKIDKTMYSLKYQSKPVTSQAKGPYTSVIIE